jgi:type IV secretion system protein VirB10
MTDTARDPRESFRDRDVRPIVPLPRAGLSSAAIVGIAVTLGGALFLILDSNRRAIERGTRDASAFSQAPIAAPPPLLVPAPAPAPMVLAPDVRTPAMLQASPVKRAPQLPTPAAAASAPPPLPSPPPPLPMPPSVSGPALAGGAPSNSPALVIDLGRGSGAAGSDSRTEGGSGSGASAADDDQAVRASIIRNRSSLVPQGTLIAAVLETPIDSTRPGMARALVSHDIRGFDGSRVLIPKGSRLIGEARGDVQPGQRRVLVTWTRLIRPDGVAIRIGSPGADTLGGAGLSGRVNSHFFERFANAVLQSALQVGVNLASRPGNGSVIVGVPGQVTGTIAQTPIFTVPNGPTVKVPQGAEIAIFVARDLDFGGTVARP